MDVTKITTVPVLKYDISKTFISKKLYQNAIQQV